MTNEMTGYNTWVTASAYTTVDESHSSQYAVVSPDDVGMDYSYDAYVEYRAIYGCDENPPEIEEWPNDAREINRICLEQL